MAKDRACVGCCDGNEGHLEESLRQRKSGSCSHMVERMAGKEDEVLGSQEDIGESKIFLAN